MVKRTFRLLPESIPVCCRPFPTFSQMLSGRRSTGSKQTSKGLFICSPLNPPKGEDKEEIKFYNQRSFLVHSIRLRDDMFKELFNPILQLFLAPPFGGQGGFYALISTSTPDGRSSLLNASTVLEDEVYMSNNLLCVHN